jgi:hypothetical protein
VVSKWQKCERSRIYPQRYALSASNHFYGAKNGLKTGIMYAIAQSVAGAQARPLTLNHRLKQSNRIRFITMFIPADSMKPGKPHRNPRFMA